MNCLLLDRSRFIIKKNKKGVYLRPYLIILCDYTFTIIREIRPSAISSSRIVITSQPVSVTTS